MEIYTQFLPPPAVVCTDFGKGVTRQSDKVAADLNRIMAQYEKTGMLPQVVAQGLFADVSQVSDYRQALHDVELAEKAFMALPAKVRAQFENDAAAFLDFASNPENRDALVEMGLIEKAKDPPAAAPPRADPDGVVVP